MENSNIRFVERTKFTLLWKTCLAVRSISPNQGGKSGFEYACALASVYNPIAIGQRHVEDAHLPESVWLTGPKLFPQM